jgi:DNA polymerase V
MSTAAIRGFAAIANDHLEAPLDIYRLLVKHPAATFIMRASGQSMSPAICSGDLLLVDKSLTARDGDIIIAMVKRLFKREGLLTLLPENREYSPIDVTAGFDFQIWGVVTYIIRDTCTPS